MNKHVKLQQRVDRTVKGLNLDLGVGLLGNTVKLDLGLGILNGKSKSKRKARSARHEAGSHHDKRLLGLNLDLGLGGLLGGGGSDADNSLVSVNLGVQTIVDDPWNDAVTTRLMNSQNDNAVRICIFSPSTPCILERAKLTHSLYSILPFLRTFFLPQWFANISFGTPKQTLSMFIDSGSADTTVFDPTCTTCGLATRKAFNHPSSSTFTNANAAFSTAYGDGTTLSGFLGKDIVGLSPGLSTNANQLLGVITSQVKGSGARLYDGILGIGPDQLSFVENNITPFSKLVKESKIIRPLVGIALVKKGTLGNLQGGGEYRWGGINSAYVSTGGVIYTPVTSAFYWGVDVPGIYVDNVQMYNPTEPKRAIIDTGTTLVYVSTPVANNIHSKIPGSSFNSPEGAWYVPCSVSNLPRTGNANGDPNVFFEIGGHRWGIPVQDLAFRASGRNDGLCISGIQGGSNSFAILGDVFLKNKCKSMSDDPVTSLCSEVSSATQTDDLYLLFHFGFLPDLVLSYGNTQQSALQVGLANRTDVATIL